MQIGNVNNKISRNILHLTKLDTTNTAFMVQNHAAQSLRRIREFRNFLSLELSIEIGCLSIVVKDKQEVTLQIL